MKNAIRVRSSNFHSVRRLVLLLIPLGWAIVATLAPTAACSQSTNNEKSKNKNFAELRESLSSKLNQVVAAEKFPGATLAVVLRDGKLIELAGGFSDLESKTRMRPTDRMFCGSTGKTFVSAVVLKLVAKQKLDLDDLASKYFDSESEKEWFDLLPNASSITIRSLMNHTSGLPRYLFQKEYLADLKNEPYRKRGPVEGLKAIGGAKPLHDVGKGWSYSDTNYLLLGLIIEKVTQKTYYSVAENELFKAINLKNTLPATQPKIQGLVPGYVGSNNFFDLPRKTLKGGKYVMDPTFEWCGGGFVTNSGDLAKWLHSLHQKKHFAASIHTQLVTPVDFRTGRPSNSGYGLGCFVWNTSLGDFYGHAGVMPGYLTQIEFSKDHQFSVAFQTNTDEGLGRKHHQLVQEFAKIVVAHLKKE